MQSVIQSTVDVEWHRQQPDDVLARLGSSTDGLDSSEAASRLDRFGTNELEDKGTKHPLRLVWEQISAVMVLILIGAALLSLALGKLLEAGAIGAIVVLFAALGFLQEYRAEQAIAALAKLSVPRVRVVRDGRPVEVSSVELVPGDVVQVEAGSVIPADMRVIDSANLRIQEAALTGESEPVDKRAEAVDADGLALGDRRSMAYSGTQVTYGRGTGVVVATGMDTELGRIATLLQDVGDERTPLQDRLDQVGKQLALVGLAVAAIVVAMGAVGGEPLSELVLTAISVAVAVIPEGLPAVVTFTLAIGAQRMLRRNSLIRKLPAVETLGSVTVICSDKTGTLTLNQMTVTVLEVAGRHLDIDHTAVDPAEVLDRPALSITLAAGLLCNDGSLEVGSEDQAGQRTGTRGPAGDPTGELKLLGDPTETALLAAAHWAGMDVDGIRRTLPRIGENPFDSERKRMSTVHRPLEGRVPELAALPQDQPVAFVKGAVDRLLPLATHVWDDGPVAMTDEWRDRIASANDTLASDGMRVLGVGLRILPQPDDGAEPDPGLAEVDITLVGMVGIIDPPRDEVRDAVEVCRRAGIRPVMITGDHPLTARAIAKDLGIGLDSPDPDRVITGADLDRIDPGGLDEVTREVSVFARVSPEHKLRIVESLQGQNQVVAMTGDGVNDAPALKRADIGVAMGITGTDVSKEASDMVLRDDNFATIVAAVEEGRVIYDNLRRFVSFAVAGNLGKIIVMLGWPVPFLLSDGGSGTAVALLPLQLLWLNLMTDGLLGLSMGVEPPERGVMERSPNVPGSGLWSDGLGIRTAWVGVVIGVVALAVGFVYNSADRVEWQSMMFTSLAFLQVFQAIGTRSNTESLATIGFTTNRLMLAIAGVVSVLQLAALYTPLRRFLGLEPLPGADLALCVGLGLGLLAVLELVKAIRRR